MTFRLVHRMILIMAAVVVAASVAFAQTSSGEISGRVVDAAGAVVVNADVTLTNQFTGDTRGTKTDDSGGFVFVAVQPGTFMVSVKAPAFKQFDKRDLKLSASGRLSAGTLKLEIGAVSETVSIAAEATAVQTESAERSALLDSKELSTLTSLTRDPLALLRVLPGVVKTDDGANGLSTAGAGTIAGVRESSNAVSIDGVNGNPRGDGNKLDTPLNMDAVSEIKVVLNSYQAQYGQSAGAIINLTTKSGSQQFHGSGYYYGRNEALNANSWFNNYKGLPRGVYRYNTVGWNVGGPIYIPNRFNSRRDKLFFFFSQERWPTKTNSGYQQFMMPTAAERNGDFSQTYDTKGNKVYIRDPLLNLPCSASNQTGCFTDPSRATAANPTGLNIIPASRINPNMQKIVNIFPLPTINCVAGPYGVGTCPLTNVTTGVPYNYQIFAPREEPANQTVLRLDYNITDKWKMYFRGMMEAKENRGLTSTTNKLNWGIPSYYSTPSKNGGINLTYLATPTLVNEFTVGYASWDELQGFTNAADLDKLSKTALGISLGQNNPSQNPTDLVPRITGLSSGGSSPTFQLSSGSSKNSNTPEINFDNRWPMNNSTGTWEFTDGVTKLWNRHTLKAGVYSQMGRYIQRHIGSVFSGNFDIGANNTSPYDTQYAYSNMLLGSYNSYQEGSNVVNYAPHWYILEWYLQDSWKVKSNLSMDYGVRFTYDLPTELQPGFGAGFVPGRYDRTQVPALYNGVPYATLTASLQTLCKGTYRTTPTTCAQNPNNPTDIRMDTFIGTFVAPFNYTGTVINTDSTYPDSLRWSNGLLPAPRFGISWDPFNDGKTAVRFGTGLYYNTREGGGTVGDYSLIAPLTTNAKVGFGQVTDANFLPGCGAGGNCYGTARPVNANPLDTRILQPHRRVESTLGVNFGIQRNVGFDTVVDVAYVGTFGRHLNQQLNLNAVPYGRTVTNLDISNMASGTYDKAYNCYYDGSSVNRTTGVITGYCQRKTQSDNYVRPYQGYAAINLRDYGSTSNYNALQTSVNRRFTKGLQFGVSYTWSKTMTYQDTVNGAVANFQDRRFWNYGEASFDRTHNLVFHWTANMPKASRLWNNRILRAVGNNWEWSGITQFISGAPWTVDMSGNPNLTYGGDGAHVLLLGNPYASKDALHSTKQYLNLNVWAMPCAPGLPANLVQSSGCVVVPMSGNGTYLVPDASTPGLTRLNAFRGPGINNWDMSLEKNIPVGERLKFAIRVEAYNIFNHVSFTSVGSNNNATVDFDTTNNCKKSPDGTKVDPICGTGAIKSTSTFGQVNGERGARKLQLSARFRF